MGSAVWKPCFACSDGVLVLPGLSRCAVFDVVDCDATWKGGQEKPLYMAKSIRKQNLNNV